MPRATPKPDRRAVDIAFGRVLRGLRQQRGLSQEQLGNETGAGRTYVSQLERGVKGGTLKTLFRLADELDVPPWEIVKLVETELRRPSN